MDRRERKIGMGGLGIAVVASGALLAASIGASADSGGMYNPYGNQNWYGYNRGAAPARNFTACQVHRNAYNTYVTFYNNASTRAEKESWRRTLEEERQQMQIHCR
jgi:hypothetical protein